jgi:hypothetical protein
MHVVGPGREIVHAEFSAGIAPRAALKRFAGQTNLDLRRGNARSGQILNHAAQSSSRILCMKQRSNPKDWQRHPPGFISVQADLAFEPKLQSCLFCHD